MRYKMISKKKWGVRVWRHLWMSPETVYFWKLFVQLSSIAEGLGLSAEWRNLPQPWMYYPLAMSDDAVLSPLIRCLSFI